MKSNIGKDLWRITFPVTFNEPVGLLQRCAELLEYHQLIRQANRLTNPHLRLLNVLASFFLTYSNTVKRFNKAFNPLLGETYEYIQDDLKFIAEQVCHHPPVSAFHAECNDFIMEGNLQF